MSEGELDINALRLITGGDRQIEGELAGLYMETVGRCLEGLCGQPENWQMLIHVLKGASASMQAVGVVSACRLAERAQGEAERSRAYRQLRSRYRDVEPLLRALGRPQ